MLSAMRISQGAFLAVVFLGAHLTAHAATVVHRYSFDANANDSIGSANATLIGGANVSNGQLVLPGGAPRTNYASLPLSVGTEINGFTALTIEIWFTQNVPQNWSKAFYFGNNAGGFADDGLELCPQKGDGSGTAKVEFLNNRVADAFGANSSGDPSPIYDTGNKHYVAAVFDTANDLLSFYSDGVLAGTKPIFSGELSDLNLTGLFIGAAVGWGDPDFNGAVDEFRVWNGALSDTQVAAQAVAGPNVVVPEPSGCALLASAFGLFGLRRRRRASRSVIG
jgi:hypothetical protein